MCVSVIVVVMFLAIVIDNRESHPLNGNQTSERQTQYPITTSSHYKLNNDMNLIGGQKFVVKNFDYIGDETATTVAHTAISPGVDSRNVPAVGVTPAVAAAGKSNSIVIVVIVVVIVVVMVLIGIVLFMTVLRKKKSDGKQNIKRSKSVRSLANTNQ